MAGEQALAPAPVLIRVVVVTMYQPSDATDSEPGEYRVWANRMPQADRLTFPFSDHPLCLDRARGILVVNTGVGPIRAACAVTALGLDPRFDVSRSYWLAAGIAGGNADIVPLASACWAEWVVDGDLAHQIDGREIPADWTTGFVPLLCSRPFQKPRPGNLFGNVRRLNPALATWAYELTREVPLSRPDGLDDWLSEFASYAAASRPPVVMKGDTLSTGTFWHGKRMNDWAAEWVRYWTDGAGSFATSAMEDAATLSALDALAAAGRVDRDRALVLRTTSNFTVQPGDQTAAQSLAMESEVFSAMRASVEACYTVGRVVVDEIADNWDRYGDAVPGGN